MDSGIYVWKLNGVPKYVGLGSNVKKRMMDKHKRCKALSNAVNKYGFDSFEKEIICYCEPDKMGDLEKYYIQELSTHFSYGGYNISWGGEEPWNRGLKGVQVSANKGKNFSEETKEKMSIAKQGKPAPMKGKKHSEETKKKQSNSHKNMSEETRQKMSLSAKLAWLKRTQGGG